MSELICCICATYNRPELLGRAIRSFEKQTYKNKFSIIVDDLGQYKNQEGDKWELVSFPRKILSLGEKRNVCSALAPRETWGYARWDDDDVYMPWHLEAMADALGRCDFVQPRYAIDFWDGRWMVTETFPVSMTAENPVRRHPGRIVRTRNKPQNKHRLHYAYGGQWGYTRKMFWKVGGYGPDYVDEDCVFQMKVARMGLPSVGFSNKYKPSYFYNRPLLDRASENWRGKTLEEAYWKDVKPTYVGTVPKWEDDSVWDQPIPTEITPRRF